MDMKNYSLYKRKKNKKKKQRKCSGSPARSCRAVICCLETFMIKDSFPASFFCHHKVKPFYKTNNMQTLKHDTKETARIMHLINLYIINLKDRICCFFLPGKPWLLWALKTIDFFPLVKFPLIRKYNRLCKHCCFFILSISLCDCFEIP